MHWGAAAASMRLELPAEKEPVLELQQDQTDLMERRINIYST